MTELSDTVPRKLPASAQGRSRQLKNSDRLSGFRATLFSMPLMPIELLRDRA
jgi:hypothetical protein